MAQIEIGRTSNDVVMKYIAQAFGGALFARFNIPLPPIVAALPSEVPVLDIHLAESDGFYALADTTVAHLEFQTTSGQGDLLRFASYNWAGVMHYQTKVYTIVFYGPQVTSAPAQVECGSHVITVYQIFVGDLDGAATWERIHQQNQRGEALSAADRVELILLPLMRWRGRERREVARLVVEESARLAEEARQETVGAMIGLAYRYLAEGEANSILEGLLQMNMLTHLLSEKYSAGETQGRVEGQQTALLLLLHERFGAPPLDVAERVRLTTETSDLTALLQRAIHIERLDDLFPQD